MNLRAATAEDFAWFRERDGVLTTSATGVVAIDASGDVRGMVAYDWTAPASAEIHVWTESMAAFRALLRAAFAYPFLEKGKEFLLASIPSHRWQAVRLAKRMGFEEMSRVHDGWRPGSDLVSFCLARKDCRFLQPITKAA